MSLRGKGNALKLKEVRDRREGWEKLPVQATILFSKLLSITFQLLKFNFFTKKVSPDSIGSKIERERHDILRQNISARALPRVEGAHGNEETVRENQ